MKNKKTLFLGVLMRQTFHLGALKRLLLVVVPARQVLLHQKGDSPRRQVVHSR